MIQLINISGLLSNIIGTIILAFSLNKYLGAIHGSIAIHDITINGIVKQDNKVIVANSLGTLLTKGATAAKVRTQIGLFLIALGSIFQLISYLLL